MLRRPQITKAGLKLPLRMLNSRSLQCLWHHYESTDLLDEVHRVLINNRTQHALGVTDMILNVNIHEEEYIVYRDVTMPMQGEDKF